MFISILSKASPHSADLWGRSNLMSSRALGEIGKFAGPRCCKRDSYLAILAAIDFVDDHFGIKMYKPEVVCAHSGMNNQCIGNRCPFKEGRAQDGKNS